MREKDGAALLPGGSAWARRARAAWFWTKAAALNSTLNGSPELRYYAPDAYLPGLVWWLLALMLVGTTVLSLALGLEAHGRVALVCAVLVLSLVAPCALGFFVVLAGLTRTGGDDWIRRAEASALLDEALRHGVQEGHEIAERALVLDPRSIRCRLWLARANAELGDVGATREHLHAAIHELDFAIARKSERGGYTTVETRMRDALGAWLHEMEQARSADPPRGA